MSRRKYMSRFCIPFFAGMALMIVGLGWAGAQEVHFPNQCVNDCLPHCPAANNLETRECLSVCGDICTNTPRLRVLLGPDRGPTVEKPAGVEIVK
jgi:hypothetical protein